MRTAQTNSTLAGLRGIRQEVLLPDGEAFFEKPTEIPLLVWSVFFDSLAFAPIKMTNNLVPAILIAKATAFVVMDSSEIVTAEARKQNLVDALDVIAVCVADPP